jgi:GH35 family endo-1,4-beta-xylanase
MSVPTPHKALGRLIARFFLPVLMVLVSCAGTPVIRSADSTAASSSVSRDSPGADGLAGIYSEYFPIGAAVNSATITSARDMLSNEFSMLTAENEMKPSIIHPRYGTWHFYAADEIADYARKHGMTMRGHCFVWHSQTPGWFFFFLRGTGRRRAPVGAPR